MEDLNAVVQQKMEVAPGPCIFRPDNTVIFLCGHAMMIKGMEILLTGEGFTLHSRREPGNLIKEQFS